MKKRKWIVPTAVILVLIAAVGIIVKAKQEKEIVLEFGMFT